jgi:dolichol-phosphate mannosyltransferase
VNAIAIMPRQEAPGRARVSRSIRKVSIVVPVYNESLTIRELLRRICAADLLPGVEKEVIVVDDGSTDSTVPLVHEFLEDHPEHAPYFIVHRGLVNHGKGAALRAGFKLASGDVIIVQDGDLEYSPSDYPALLAPFAQGARVVYGSRFHAGFPKRMRFLNKVANCILSYATRALYGQPITDEATGYKVFRREVLDLFELECLRFEFCPEFTSKVFQAGLAIHEVPISYDPRGILEGKKIRAIDGFIALWWLVKLRACAVVRGTPARTSLVAMQAHAAA